MNFFIKLYGSNKSDLRNMVSQLETQAEGHGTGYSIYPIELIKDGKKLLFIDDYKLNLIPVYINVSSTYDNTEIFVYGYKLGTADVEYFIVIVSHFTLVIYSVNANMY